MKGLRKSVVKITGIRKLKVVEKTQFLYKTLVSSGVNSKRIKLF